MAAFRRVVLVACLITLAPFAAAQERVDFYGDPLPNGALARLGTIRLRTWGQFGDAAFDPDGGILATAAGPRILFWDTNSGRLLREESTSANSVRRIRYSPNGKLFAAAVGEALVVWDTETQQRVCAVQTEASSITFSADGSQMAIVDRDGSLHFWKLGEKGAVPGPSRPEGFSQVEFSAGGEWVLAATTQQLFRISAETGRVVHEWNAHEARITDIDISPDDSQVVSCGVDGSLAVWEAETGKLHWLVDDRTAGNSGSYVRRCRFAPDGMTLATVGTKLQFWDVEKQSLLRTFDETRGDGLRWAPDGRHVVVLRSSGFVIRDVLTGAETPKLTGHRGYANQIFFRDDGSSMLTVGGSDSSAFQWRSDSGEIVRQLSPPSISQLTPIPETDLAIVWAQEGLAVCDLNTGARRDLAAPAAPGVSQDSVHSISADGRRLVTSQSSSRRVYQDGRSYIEFINCYAIWRFPAGEQWRNFSAVDIDCCPQISPDGETLYHVTKQYWEQPREQERPIDMVTIQLKARPFEEPTVERERVVWESNFERRSIWGVPDLEFSADSRLGAMALGNEGVAVVDLATGELLHHWKTPTVRNDFRHVAFSADGKRVLGGPLRCFLWDLETGRELQVFEPPAKCDICLLSPKGDLLATGDDRGVVTLWNTASGEPVVELKGHRARVRKLRFSPDSKRLVSSADDNQTLVWSLEPADRPRPDEAVRTVSTEELWGRLGSPKAAEAYAAAAELIAAPEATVKLLGEHIREPIVLPLYPPFRKETELRAHRAAYVLEQIGGEEALAIRRLIEYPRPVLKDFDPQREYVDHRGAALPPGAVLGMSDIDALPKASADGRLLIQWKDQQSFVCNLVSHAPEAALPLSGEVMSLSRSGRFGVLYAGGGRESSVCEIATGSLLMRLEGITRDDTPQILADERQVVAGEKYQEQTAVFDLLTGELQPESRFNELKKRSSPNGRLSLRFDYENKEIFMRDTYTGEVLWREAGRASNAVTQFSEDGCRLLYANDSLTQIRNSRSGALVESIALEEKRYAARDVSPCLSAMLVVEGSNSLALYDLLTGMRVKMLTSSRGGSVEWLDDGRHFRTRNADRTGMLWDLATFATPRREGESNEALFERLWLDLTGLDVPAAYAASWAFVLAGEEGAEFLAAKLAEERQPTEEEVRALIAQLDDDAFARREAASRELAAMGELVIPHLVPLLTRQSPPEIRLRAEKVIQTIRLRASSRTRERVAWITRQISGVPAAPVE